MLSSIRHVVLCLCALGVNSAAAAPEDRNGEPDPLPPQWYSFSLEQAVKVRAVSRPEGSETGITFCLDKAQFHLDDHYRLTAVFIGGDYPFARGYRGDASLHVAVFDKTRRLLGTARVSMKTGIIYWGVKPVIEANHSLPPVDFGISKDYKDACFFAVAFHETPVTPGISPPKGSRPVSPSEP